MEHVDTCRDALCDGCREIDPNCALCGADAFIPACVVDWKGYCVACTQRGHEFVALGLSIARFVRRAEVVGLVDAVGNARQRMVVSSREFERSRELWRWDVYAAALDDHETALTRLAELAMGGR